VLAALPFGNTTTRLVLRGAALIEALENGLGRLPAPSGRFPQLSGLRFTADATRPAGSRVVSAEIRGADGHWQPLDPGRAYSLATNNFLRRGGDGYAVFAEGALEARDDGPLLDDVLVRLIGR
jgi:5'-nucleotidase/UDP-sugar diphosphatase